MTNEPSEVTRDDNSFNVSEGEGEKMKYYIDKYGVIVEKSKSAYTVWLQGSYRYSNFSKRWWYEVKSIKPHLPLKGVFSEDKLF